MYIKLLICVIVVTCCPNTRYLDHRLNTAKNNKHALRPASLAVSDNELDPLNSSYALRATEWQTIMRQPGCFGNRSLKIQKLLDTRYGKENWRVGWVWQGRIIGEEEMRALFEEAYYQHLVKHPALLDYLIQNARDIYDLDPSDIDSGTNYWKQGFDLSKYRLRVRHLQDIAIRRVIRLRLELNFKGSKLIQIRSTSEDKIGRELSPGFVPFHMPGAVEPALFNGWWKDKTIEAFCQQNRVIQIKNRPDLLAITPPVFTHAATGVIKKILSLKAIETSA